MLADRGWLSPAHRSFWHRRYHEENGYMEAATFTRFAAVPGDLVTRGREQLVDDDD